MAARRRSARLLAAAESRDQGAVPDNKRKELHAAVAVPELLVAGTSNAETELQPQRRNKKNRAAAEPTTMAATPPLPNSGDQRDDELARIKERRRLSNLSANLDRRRHLIPTVMKPKDQRTAEFVSSPSDKALVRSVGRSVVNLCSVARDGEVINQYTGIVIGRSNEKTRTNQKPARILTSFDVLRETNLSLQIRLANGTMLQGQVMFVNEHYNIALLETRPSQAADDDLPLQPPSFGSNPNYGHRSVFVLARGKESNLMARHGRILWFDEPDCWERNHHLFLSCQIPGCGTGGPVVDHDGNVAGMAFYTGTSTHPTAILAASTILTCFEMWMKFDRIARPAHGLRLRTVEMLEVSLQEMVSLDHDIDSGFIVDRVASGSAAERLGIRYGDVIVSFDGLRGHPLPQLEDYFLSLGLRFLMQSSTDSTDTIDLKLQVYDPLGRSTRSIILPVEFSDDACI